MGGKGMNSALQSAVIDRAHCACRVCGEIHRTGIAGGQHADCIRCQLLAAPADGCFSSRHEKRRLIAGKVSVDVDRAGVIRDDDSLIRGDGDVVMDAAETPWFNLVVAEIPACQAAAGTRRFVLFQQVRSA